MADVVSSVNTLFSTILQGFEYIQIARTFEADVGLYQSKLAIIQLRLSRWGEAVGVDHEHKELTGGGTSDTNTAKLSLAPNTSAEEVEEILHSIDQALKRAKRQSAKWKPSGVDDSDLGQDDDDYGHLKPRFKRLKVKIRKIVEKRCRQLSTGVEGDKWAIYKKEQCDALVTQLVDHLDQLEKAVEQESKLTELSHEESEAMGDSLNTLLQAVGNCDSRLRQAASDKLEHEAPSGGISITATTNNGLQIFNNWAPITGTTTGTGQTVTHHWYEKGSSSQG